MTILSYKIYINHDVKLCVICYLPCKPDKFTISHVAELWHKLLLFAVFSAWHQALVKRRVGIPIHVHQERRRHKMGCLLRLLI